MQIGGLTPIVREAPSAQCIRYPENFSMTRGLTSHSSRPPANVPLINLVWRVVSCVFRAGGGSIPALDACVDLKPVGFASSLRSEYA